jgi:uncharacterized protein YndB with AHSA1/START domain
MSEPAELSVRVERLVSGSPEEVFAACVEPDRLARWWGPAGFSAPSIELNAREGGRYRIAMQPPEGDVFHLGGVFRVVEPSHRLAYSFEWEEPTPDDRETLVTLTFERVGPETRVVVEHGVFSTEERRALHERGWQETLDRLARCLEASEE